MDKIASDDEDLFILAACDIEAVPMPTSLQKNALWIPVINEYNTIPFIALNDIAFCIINLSEKIKFCEFNISQNVVKRIKSKIEDFPEMVPRVCYDGGKMEKILFESLFGSSKRDDGYGYVYHFYEYSEAIERAEKDRPNSKTKNSGVLRYVIFEDQLTTDSYDMFLPLTVHKI